LYANKAHPEEPKVSRITSTRFLSFVALLFVPAVLFAGNESGYRVLSPITSGNL